MKHPHFSKLIAKVEEGGKKGAKGLDTTMKGFKEIARGLALVVVAGAIITVDAYAGSSIGRRTMPLRAMIAAPTKMARMGNGRIVSSVIRTHSAGIGMSGLHMSDAVEGQQEEPAKKGGILSKVKAIVPPASERQKLVPLAIMFFCILFNYTILRDTKDVLMVTAPKSGAEVIVSCK